MSNAATSDDSGGEPVAAAADAFNLSSAVKHILPWFNNSANDHIRPTDMQRRLCMRAHVWG